jgi:hypothetical protein
MERQCGTSGANTIKLSLLNIIAKSKVVIKKLNSYFLKKPLFLLTFTQDLTRTSQRVLTICLRPPGVFTLKQVSSLISFIFLRRQDLRPHWSQKTRWVQSFGGAHSHRLYTRAWLIKTTRKWRPTGNSVFGDPDANIQQFLKVTSHLKANRKELNRLLNLIKTLT